MVEGSWFEELAVCGETSMLSDWIRQIPITDSDLLSDRWHLVDPQGQVFETSVPSCELSLAISSVNKVASWLARDTEHRQSGNS